MIQSIDEPLMKHCIFTTGTVLISRSALSKADVLPGCFVEPVFNSEKARWQIVGATGFYSWKHKKGGSGLPGSRLRQENLWQKIMKDTAQEQALLEVADLLQQLKNIG